MSAAETPTPSVPVRREIKSFVRREGRITSAQKDALETLWPRYGLDAPAAAAPYALASLFGRDALTVFEIGFGAGEALLVRAAEAPEKNFIGVEVHRPGIGRVLNRAETAGLCNLRVARHDAVEVLRDWMAPQSLDELILEFPDPWHKSRHHKRRIVQPAFVALVASRLKPGGLFRLATDWVPYAEHMREVLDASSDFTGGAVPRPESRPITRFEARGERLGHVFNDLLYVRR